MEEVRPSPVLRNGVIGYQMWEKVFQMFAHILLVVMLEATEATGVEQDKNNHNFSITHAVGLVAMILFLVFNYIFSLLQYKFLTKIIVHTINLWIFKL